MSDRSGRETGSLSEHEARLRQVGSETREYIVADWATSNLASVIQLAGASDWASRAGQHREHATAFLSVRILRACRAAMEVLAAGWDTEGMGVTRQVVEINASLRGRGGPDAGDRATLPPRQTEDQHRRRDSRRHTRGRPVLRGRSLPGFVAVRARRRRRDHAPGDGGRRPPRIDHVGAGPHRRHAVVPARLPDRSLLKRRPGLR